MTLSFSVIFYLKYYILRTRKSLKVQILEFLSVPENLTKLLMPCLKLHGQSFQSITVQCLERQILCICVVAYFGQKEPIKNKFSDFWVLGWIFTKFLMSYLKPYFTKFALWYFDMLLLLKVYKISAKNVQRSFASWHWRMMQNLKRNWLIALKLTWRIWPIFTSWKLAISFWKVKW